MAGYRIAQVNDLVRQNLDEILRRELSLKPGVFLTIAKVDTSRDLRYTRVFLSIFPEKETDYALETLKKEMFAIQGKLNRKLVMRPLPRVTFLSDRTEAEADKVEKILEEIHQEKKC